MTHHTSRAIMRDLKQYEGSAVSLYAIGDRNRILQAQGILDGVYPDIFTVRVDNGSYQKRYCYAYSEILTQHVKIRPLEGSA